MLSGKREAHRLLYHSTLGSRVRKKKEGYRSEGVVALHERLREERVRDGVVVLA